MKLALIPSLKNPAFNFKVRADKARGYCFACGQTSIFDYEEFINDDLARQWGIDIKTRHAYSARESRQCKSCGSNYRNRQYAQVLCEQYGQKRSLNLRDLVEDKNFRSLSIAEINACGHLHQFFEKLPKLEYSEFEPNDKSISSEDLHNLSYSPDKFDLVLTSDTLEHVPNYKKAFKEIYRVLKPGGQHIFTIPVIWRNHTKRRAEMNGGKIEYLLEPAYHGPAEDANLVWTDFGYEILDDLAKQGFKTKVHQYNLLNSYDAGCVFISTKL
jgi:SAM-dependent methyltransferase